MTAQEVGQNQQATLEQKIIITATLKYVVLLQSWLDVAVIAFNEAGDCGLWWGATVRLYYR